MINVTKSVLPNRELFDLYIDKIWESGQLTNHGPLVAELEEKLKSYLDVKHLFLLNNGTIALQIAIKALELKGEIITTPFSYVATTSSIVWENCIPVFADIDPSSLSIDIQEIEKKITDKTSAILATHVYGIPCNVDAIRGLATKYGLKVIYDAAHAFGIKCKKRGILNFGDVSSISFHATKLFHTIEGGALATNDDAIAKKISYMRNFGHNGPSEFIGAGINGKASEFNAAMGLSILPQMQGIISNRNKLSDLYDAELMSGSHKIRRPLIGDFTTYNYSYYPIILESEEMVLSIMDALGELKIYPRRYFYPSLNTLSYLDRSYTCPISEDISKRVLCLPLYHDLDIEILKRITIVINNVLN